MVDLTKSTLIISRTIDDIVKITERGRRTKRTQKQRGSHGSPEIRKIATALILAVESGKKR